MNSSIICILLIGTVCLYNGAWSADVARPDAVHAYATATPIVHRFDDDDGDLDDFEFESDSVAAPAGDPIGLAIPIRDDGTEYENAAAIEVDGTTTNDANQLDSMFDDVEVDVEQDSFSEKEKRIRAALLKSSGDKRNRRIFTQITPILRSLSKPQRVALAALVSAQLSLESGQELTLAQVRFFTKIV